MKKNLKIELINNNTFREKNYKYLNDHPLISKPDFKLIVNDFYDNSVCTFELKPYFYKNLYDNWKIIHKYLPKNISKIIIKHMMVNYFIEV